MDYCPVRVSTLRGDQKITFDLYLLINDKYILYLRRGDSFEGTRLDRLRNRKLRKMFIQPDDEYQYRDYVSRNIDMAYSNTSDRPITVRAEIVQGHQQATAETLMEFPADEKSYNLAKEGAAHYIEFLKNDAALKAILNLPNVDHSISHHGVAVATFAVALAQRLDLCPASQQQFLILGSLLHDFQNYKSNGQFNRPLSAFSKEELVEYRLHPTRGVEALRSLRNFDIQVLNIIYQHEEKLDGSGFPQRLVENMIDSLALIVSCANCLDRMIAFEQTPAKEAGKKLFMSEIGRYPLEYLKTLQEIVRANF